MLRFLLSLCMVCIFALPVFAQDEVKLNINTATAEQLASVGGLPVEIANGVIGYRDEMGDIMSMDELLDVDGMNKKLLEQLQEDVGLEALTGADCAC